MAALARLIASRDEAAGRAAHDRPRDAADVSPVIEEILFGSRPAAEALLAFRGAEAIGFLLFHGGLVGRDLRRAVVVADLFVLPAARRVGAGRALVARLRRIARSRLAVRVDLQVPAANEGARAFFAAQGLKEQGTIAVGVAL